MRLLWLSTLHYARLLAKSATPRSLYAFVLPVMLVSFLCVCVQRDLEARVTAAHVTALRDRLRKYIESLAELLSKPGATPDSVADLLAVQMEELKDRESGGERKDGKESK